MGLIKMIRVLFGIAKGMKQSRAQAEELSSMAMAEFLPQWVALLSHAPDGTHPVLRQPADEGALLSVEQRLGCVLPAELKDLYRLSDGIDWSSADYRKNLDSTSELRFASAHSPTLSAQLEAQWQNWGREDGQPKGLKIFSASVVELMMDTPERVIPFDEVDDMLALEVPEEGRGTVLVVKAGRHFPAGTVLEVENLVATRYESIRQWLGGAATSLSLNSSLADSSILNGGEPT